MDNHDFDSSGIKSPHVVSTRPTVVNNQPLSGWHRVVVLAGSVMSPFDSAVLHWPPDDSKNPLRSKAEVQRWLVSHGMGVNAIEMFNFSPKDCISKFPESDSGPKSLGELSLVESSEFACDVKYRTRDFWVSECSGYPINRFFDFENKAAFKQKYFKFLGEYRKSVQDELILLVESLYEKRLDQEAKRNARIEQLRVKFQPQDQMIYTLREEYVSLECLNLLHVAATCRSKEELCESPHIYELHQQQDDFGVEESRGGCYHFRLFTPDFCERLSNEFRHFSTTFNRNEIQSGINISSGGISSSDNSDGGGGIEIGKPKTSDGVVMNRGILLDEMGFTSTFTDALVAQVIRPLARLLFADLGGGSLDNHFAFALSQSSLGRGNDGPFQLMEDNSEVSLQVCISGGHKCAGGNLLLYGSREDPRSSGPIRVSLSHHIESNPLAHSSTMNQETNNTNVSFDDQEENIGIFGAMPKTAKSIRGGGGAAAFGLSGDREEVASMRGPGRGGIGEAVIYAGNELHRYEPLRQGDDERILLVVWARSSAWRKEYRQCEDGRPVRDSSYIYF